MPALELVLELLVAVVVLATVAPLVRVPTPILLVLGGLLLALLPQVPDIVLAPDLAFLLFLPPLLYSAAFDTSIRDVRAHLQPILSLAIGLVLATTAAVAVLVHTLLPELGWPLAFALGAIVSPPDAVAAAATATFSLGDASLRFLGVGIGGLLVGLVVGWLVAHLQRHLVDPAVEIAVSLLTPFGAYVLAEQVHVSGVLATVAAGLCAGWWAPSFMAPETRL